MNKQSTDCTGAEQGKASCEHEAAVVLDVRVHVDPVCVSDWPDAHIVRFLAGNQRFDIGDAWETRDDALLYAHLFSVAIGRDFGLNEPAASRIQYMPPANEARTWVDEAFPSGTYTAGSMRTAYVAGWQSAKGLRAAVDEAAKAAGPLTRSAPPFAGPLTDASDASPSQLATPEPEPQHTQLVWADEDMARHWIDRYAAGIDGEPQMDRILDCVQHTQPEEAGSATP
jgi:hypothetical protein